MVGCSEERGKWSQDLRSRRKWLSEYILESDRPGFKPQLHHLLTVWSWAAYLTPLYLSSLT